LDSSYYKPSERRVTIHSKFKIIENHPTFSLETAICPEIETPLGNLLVYGTIIGIHGNRRESFKEDLAHQLSDFERYAGNNLCIAGDFNMSFCDNYYFTDHGRTAMNQSFESNELVNLTSHLPEAIDHICISKTFLGDAAVDKTTEWNKDKTLSDHKGVSIEIQS
jgi:endonuclease/exonuclease/phosphatase family metal-dependent hydrolase